MEHVQCNIHWNFFVLCFPYKFLYFSTSSYEVSLLGLHTELLHRPRMWESCLLITETSHYFRQFTIAFAVTSSPSVPSANNPFQCHQMVRLI